MGAICNISWADGETAQARLFDKRYQRVISEFLDAGFSSAGLSFSATCGGSLRQAAGRLVRNEKTNSDDLLHGHKHATLERCMGKQLVVIAQDSTSYNYSSHPATTGLGPLNDKEQILGIHQHAALAMTEDKLPLGIVHAKFWIRPHEKKKTNSRKQVPISEKESYKWIETIEQTQEVLASYLDSGGRGVIVGDRESDIFDLFAAERHENLDLLVRAAHRRKVKVPPSDEECTLFEAGDVAPVRGEYEIEVCGEDGAPARMAKMQLRSAPVLLKPPIAGVGHTEDSIPVWVVKAVELLPEGSDVTPLLWRLITTREASSMDSARHAVKLYTCRWGIERLHYTLKSGCKAERLQMDDAKTLCNTLALYIIVAWRLLYVTHLARTDPEAPAGQIIDETEQAVLTQMTRKKIETVADVVLAVTKMAGYEPYKNGPPPGVKSLWLGIRMLESMSLGWKLAMTSMRHQKM